MGRLAAAALVLLWASGARADDEPSDRALVLVGAAMAVPTYFVGVALHEGSHAIGAKLVGAEIVEVKLLPGFSGGRFYFGYTRWRGDLGRGEKTFALVAPKITNAIFLGGYAALVAADALPENEWGALALAVFVTGEWVDFTKAVFEWREVADLNKVYRYHGATSFWERLPWRALHAGLAAASGYALWLGWKDVFADDATAAGALFVPLALGRF